MNLKTLTHRIAQVLLHLAAVARQWLSAAGVARPVGAAGDAHLRALGASASARRAFAAAHPADQASATRAASALRRLDASEDDQLAALLHDLAKGRVGLVPRILHVLEGSPVAGRARGPWSAARGQLRAHAAAAPDLAARLGAPKGTVALLRELARQESRSAGRSEVAGMTTRVQRLIDVDSGFTR